MLISILNSQLLHHLDCVSRRIPDTCPPNPRTTPPETMACHSTNADADVVLRSADNVDVDFCVYRVILSKASPWFSTMFSLPQQDTSADIASHRPGQNLSSVIAMSEHSRTLAHLLTLCYPLEDPSPTSLDDLVLLLAVSQSTRSLAHASLHAVSSTAPLNMRRTPSKPSALRRRTASSQRRAWRRGSAWRTRCPSMRSGRSSASWRA